jgi:hypothetical protein
MLDLPPDPRRQFVYWVEPLLSEGTILKRKQLYREIMEVPDERLRSNLEHSFYKFQSFLDENLAPYLPKPPATDNTPRGCASRPRW